MSVPHEPQDFRLLVAHQPIGSVTLDPSHLVAVRAALATEGYALEVEEPVVDLAENCDVEDHRPCDLKVSLGVARDTAETLHLPVYGKVQQIIDRGVISEPEAEQVLRTWAHQLRSHRTATDEEKEWAAIVTETLWPSVDD